MIQPFQYVEVAVVARNNLLSTFISVQTDNHGFKYNQGNQWSSSSGSHCSCYLFSKKPLSFWGVGSFKVPVIVCLLAATPWVKKKRILSLPRDWAAGGRIFFFTWCFWDRELAEEGGLFLSQHQAWTEHGSICLEVAVKTPHCPLRRQLLAYTIHVKEGWCALMEFALSMDSNPNFIGWSWP